MVQNSWGETGDYKGIWYMTKAFIAANTMDFLINKNAIPKDIRKKLGIKFNIELIFLPKEMIKQSGSTLHVIFGDPISWSTLDASRPKQEAARLRDIVYSMTPS